MEKEKEKEKEICIGDSNGINNNSPYKAHPHPHPFRNPKLQMKKQKRMEAMSSPEEKEKEKEMEMEICIGDSNGINSRRNWCSDLPMDVFLLIMSKVGAIFILLGAQWVCKDWRKACREVPMWRSIDMTPLVVHHRDLDLKGMAREAIDRAQGNLQQFYIFCFGDNKLLQYLAHSTSLLRRLRLIETFDITGKGLAESVSRFPLLEELHLTVANFDKEVCELVGKACPHLKCFRYNQRSYESGKEEDGEALGIANYMTNLRQLQIVGNKLTNVGLMAILDKCVHLQSLDIRGCFKIHMDASLQARCAQIKDFRLPYDLTEDYDFRGVD